MGMVDVTETDEAERPAWVDDEWREFPESSNIKAIRIRSFGFNLCNVKIRFSARSVYEYHEVPRDLMDSALEAPSIGKWVQANIVQAGFGFEKIEPDDDDTGNLRPDGDEEDDQRG